MIYFYQARKQLPRARAKWKRSKKGKCNDWTGPNWTGLDWTLVAEARATTEPLFFEEKQVELWIVTGD